MLKPSRQKIIRPTKLSPSDEALALNFLSARRGRPIFGPLKDLSQIARQFVPNIKDNKIGKLNDLKAKWREIMGENIAKLCAPETINGKTLTLKVIGAASPLIQMRSKEILGLAGLAIGIDLNKLKLIQTKLEKPNDNKIKIKPLDAEQSAQLDAQLAHIDNDDLKNAIRMLKTYIQSLP